jgi:hypothetical protein
MLSKTLTDKFDLFNQQQPNHTAVYTYNLPSFSFINKPASLAIVFSWKEDEKFDWTNTYDDWDASLFTFPKDKLKEVYQLVEHVCSQNMDHCLSSKFTGKETVSFEIAVYELDNCFLVYCTDDHDFGGTDCRDYPGFRPENFNAIENEYGDCHLASNFASLRNLKNFPEEIPYWESIAKELGIDLIDEED